MLLITVGLKKVGYLFSGLPTFGHAAEYSQAAKGWHLFFQGCQPSVTLLNTVGLLKVGNPFRITFATEIIHCGRNKN
jgi:hypothetical protein